MAEEVWSPFLSFEFCSPSFNVKYVKHIGFIVHSESRCSFIIKYVKHNHVGFIVSLFTQCYICEIQLFGFIVHSLLFIVSLFISWYVILNRFGFIFHSLLHCSFNFKYLKYNHFGFNVQFSFLVNIWTTIDIFLTQERYRLWFTYLTRNQ